MEKQATSQTTNQELQSFIKRNRPSIKIKSGETMTAVFRGVKTGVETAFGQEKEVVSYLLQEVGTDRVVPWKTSSLAVAEKMQGFSVGETISISRTGTGPQDTKYQIVAAKK